MAELAERDMWQYAVEQAAQSLTWQLDTLLSDEIPDLISARNHLHECERHLKFAVEEERKARWRAVEEAERAEQ